MPARGRSGHTSCRQCGPPGSGGRIPALHFRPRAHSAAEPARGRSGHTSGPAHIRLLCPLEADRATLPAPRTFGCRARSRPIGPHFRPRAHSNAEPARGRSGHTSSPAHIRLPSPLEAERATLLVATHSTNYRCTPMVFGATVIDLPSLKRIVRGFCSGLYATWVRFPSFKKVAANG